MRARVGITIVAMAMLAAAGHAAPTATGEAKLAQAVAGRTAGKPINCLTRNPFMRDSATIEGIGTVYGRGRTIYVNRFQNGCPALNGFSTIITQTPTAQLCRGDIARIVDSTSGIDRGSCIVGDFVPYERPRK